MIFGCANHVICYFNCMVLTCISRHSQMTEGYHAVEHRLTVCKDK